MARIRVLANGHEVVNVGICPNELWTWMGDLREQLKELIENTVAGRELCTSVGRYTVNSATVSEIPFQDLFFSAEFRCNNELELMALTHGLQGTVTASGLIQAEIDSGQGSNAPCRETCSCFNMTVGSVFGQATLNASTLFSDGVYKPFLGVIDDWTLEWPRASIAQTYALDIHNQSLIGQFLSHFGISPFLANLAPFIANNIAASYVEEQLFGLVRNFLLDRIDPNGPLESFLGFTAEILESVEEALAYLGLDFPTVPCGTRFSVQIENPAEDGSTGGGITIALFAPI